MAGAYLFHPFQVLAGEPIEEVVACQIKDACPFCEGLAVLGAKTLCIEGVRKQKDNERYQPVTTHD